MNYYKKLTKPHPGVLSNTVIDFSRSKSNVIFNDTNLDINILTEIDFEVITQSTELRNSTLGTLVDIALNFLISKKSDPEKLYANDSSFSYYEKHYLNDKVLCELYDLEMCFINPKYNSDTNIHTLIKKNFSYIKYLAETSLEQLAGTAIIKPIFLNHILGIQGSGDLILNDCLIETKTSEDSSIKHSYIQQLYMYNKINEYSKLNSAYEAYTIKSFGYLNPLKGKFIKFNITNTNTVDKNFENLIKYQEHNINKILNNDIQVSSAYEKLLDRIFLKELNYKYAVQEIISTDYELMSFINTPNITFTYYMGYYILLKGSFISKEITDSFKKIKTLYKFRSELLENRDIIVPENGYLKIKKDIFFPSISLLYNFSTGINSKRKVSYVILNKKCI